MVSLYRLVVGGCSLLFAPGCAGPSSLPTNNSTEETISAPAEEAATIMFGPPRLSQSEVERFLKKARGGDADAMHTLSTHYFADNEIRLGYHWLRQAAKLGDCDAVLHLVENDFRGVTSEEMPHWRKEKKRLGCDPGKHARAKPIIRIRPDPEPEKE